MAAQRSRRGFGSLRRLPSKRWQASYTGPDLARHVAPHTFQAKGDAEAWLGGEYGLIAADRWAPPAVRQLERLGPVTFAERLGHSTVTDARAALDRGTATASGHPGGGIS